MGAVTFDFKVYLSCDSYVSSEKSMVNLADTSNQIEFFSIVEILSTNSVNNTTENSVLVVIGQGNDVQFFDSSL